MRRVFSIMTAVVCLLTSVAMAYGQQPSPQACIVLNIHIIDVDADRVEELEEVVKDRAGLDRLIAEGRARSLALVQSRARSGEQTTTRIGQRIPIQMASSPNASQIQYENTGFSLDVRPSVISGDQINVVIKLDLSTVDRTTGMATPVFIQRAMSDNVQLRSGETIVLLNVIQKDALWPAAQPATPTAGPSRGNFAVLLTARLVN